MLYLVWPFFLSPMSIGSPHSKPMPSCFSTIVPMKSYPPKRQCFCGGFVGWRQRQSFDQTPSPTNTKIVHIMVQVDFPTSQYPLAFALKAIHKFKNDSSVQSKNSVQIQFSPWLFSILWSFDYLVSHMVLRPYASKLIKQFKKPISWTNHSFSENAFTAM